MDEETQRYAAIIKIKQQRLFELDKQAAAQGEYSVAPHIQMERESLREEVGMMETAIAAPGRAETADELGPSGRFQVYYQQNREIKQSIAAVAVKLDGFIETSKGWRASTRFWLITIGIIVAVLLLTVVSTITYIVARGGQ